MVKKRLSLRIAEALVLFGTRIDKYTDGNGKISHMKWIPPFRAYRALTTNAAAATPSCTAGDWFHPADLPSGLVVGTDYTVYDMGGFWADMYLCSSSDATTASMGTVASTGTAAYISQPGVAPRVSQTIAHFKTYLSQRFASGGFGNASNGTWATKGGLMTDQHWFEIWIWTRINRWFLRGNTNGYYAADHIPVYHADPGEIGVVDGSQLSAYGASVTGGGPLSWDIPISDFCGNRWEFVDGLRLYNGIIYTAGKSINPPGSYSDPAYTNTGLTIAVAPGNSVDSYRTENALALHGIAASITTAGTGQFDGAGTWHTQTDERVAIRGGASDYGAQCPGAFNMGHIFSDLRWYIGARAVLDPR